MNKEYRSAIEHNDFCQREAHKRGNTLEQESPEAMFWLDYLAWRHKEGVYRTLHETTSENHSNGE